MYWSLMLYTFTGDVWRYVNSRMTVLDIVVVCTFDTVVIHAPSTVIQHWPSTSPVHNVHLAVICVVISDEKSTNQSTLQQNISRAAFSSFSSQRASNRSCSLYRMCADSLSGYSYLSHIIFIYHQQDMRIIVSKGLVSWKQDRRINF